MNQVSMGSVVGVVIDTAAPIKPGDPVVAAPAPLLPTDSAERKRTPLCTGLLDYAPAALAAVAEVTLNSHDFDDPEAGELLCLRNRGTGYWTAYGARLALWSLEAELGGEPDIVGGPGTIVELLRAYPRAFAAVAQVSWYGNEKHNPGQPVHHAREKSTDHPDCIARHLVEAGGFDGPMRHTACRVWRWLVMLQLECEAKGAPVARGAWVDPRGSLHGETK